MRRLVWLTRFLAALPVLVFALEFFSVPVPYLRLTRPWLSLPISLALIWASTRLHALALRRGPLRGKLVASCFALTVVACGYSVLGIELGRKLDHLALIVAIDRSRSIDLVPGAETRIESEISAATTSMRKGDRIATLAFAAEALVEDPLHPKSNLPAPQRAEVPRDGTDLGAAIRRGLSEVPPDSAARIVLLTDGVSTQGDALGEAALAAAAGVPVDVVPLDQRRLRDARVVAVTAGGRASVGEALDLRIVTSASQPTEVELRIYRDGQLVRKGDASLAQGEDVVHLREVAQSSGLHRYDVELQAKDPALDEALEDNRGSAFVRVSGESRALVLERDAGRGAALERALGAAGFQVRGGNAGNIPADLAGFAAYDLLVLSDISAVDLTPEQMAAIASYVRDLGGGLLLMGGDRSLGPGGFGKTPIEEVSPVSFDVKQERRRASLAEVIAVDYSGSMAESTGGHSKLELANEAAVRSAELLGAGDRLGVMHVDTTVSWTVPLGPITDRSALASKIRAVQPGSGGIFVDVALKASYAALSRENVQLKHLLLFADGSDAQERSHAFSLVAAAKSRGVTTSVVSLGRGADSADLERMSKLGDGRFYLIEDAKRLPAVFAQETVLAARSSIKEIKFLPNVVAPAPPLRGVDFSQAPALSGYVVTVPKGRAQLLLSGPEGDPLLATWAAGVGRAGVFTSDYKDRWGRAWTSWDGAERLFGQLARDLGRRGENPRVRLDAETSAGQLQLRASVVDEHGKGESLRRLLARVTGPDGVTTSVPLEAVGAGLYSATVAASQRGAYVVTAVDEATQKLEATTGAVLALGDELKPTGTDRGLLRRIAAQSGGKVRDTLAGVFLERDAERFAYSPLGNWLALLAAFGLLGAVAARRLSLSSPWAKLSAAFQARAAAAAPTAEEAAPGEGPSATLGRLRQRKAEAAPKTKPGREAPFARAAPSAPSAPASLASTAHPGVKPIATPQPASTAPAVRPPSAAEILLAKRRGRREPR